MRNTISRTTGLTLSALVLFTVTTASAQTQINPQLGLTYQNLTGKLVQGQDFKGSVGYTLGADLRFGNRLFFQPGVFLSRNRTISSYDGGNVIESESKLITTNLKLRALVGYRIIDSYQFDLRLVAGPSYDVLMSVDGKDNNGIAWNKGDFSTGSFNVEAGLGFDMGMFTLAPMASFGLNRAFSDAASVKDIDSRYITYGLTIGVNFGDDDKND
ncbi:MAG: outer membrane beta-barrel protein [Bacteroidetes bacterium]|jgi:hypothetical protein|nr:outer membrane beta-barrel protein [Bacteroidota bacterium]MBX7127709.1 PorT family protein [Flavobacteriales bacterium]MCC6654745.1 outer membrane beta-barrel protein [Flavobacteriales bacterium]HMU15683.1 outer membrane beta-barrel protein [Flavobacteriales bacterium]HMW96087.1 outer membrane beta-barrel protein [Flavobacteriales bacterium]